MNWFLLTLLLLAGVYILWLQLQLYIARALVKSFQANTVLLQTAKTKTSGAWRGVVVTVGLLLLFLFLALQRAF